MLVARSSAGRVPLRRRLGGALCVAGSNLASERRRRRSSSRRSMTMQMSSGPWELAVPRLFALESSVRPRVSIVATGGGSRVANWLLGTPGASGCVLEIMYPYHRQALLDYLGPDLGPGPISFASRETALMLARRARMRGLMSITRESCMGHALELSNVGVGCSSALATVRERRGDDVGFVAISCSSGLEAIYTVHFHKGGSRDEQDSLVSACIVKAVTDAFLSEDAITLDSPLVASQSKETLSPASSAPPDVAEALLASGVAPVWFWPSRGAQVPLADLISAEQMRVRLLVISGSFNPLHEGHERLAEAAMRCVEDSEAVAEAVAEAEAEAEAEEEEGERERELEERQLSKVNGTKEGGANGEDGEDDEDDEDKDRRETRERRETLQTRKKEDGRREGKAWARALAPSRGLGAAGGPAAGRVAAVFELSVANADKASLDLEETSARVRQFADPSKYSSASGPWPVVVTQAARFVDKAALFPGAIFVVGYDTAVRLVDPKYYEGNEAKMCKALARIHRAGCSFLVAGRSHAADEDGAFKTFEDMSGSIPPGFEQCFAALSEEQFRVDVSSTEIRARIAAIGKSDGEGGTDTI